MSKPTTTELVNDYGASGFEYAHDELIAFQWTAEAVRFQPDRVLSITYGPYQFRRTACKSNSQGMPYEWAVSWRNRWGTEKHARTSDPYGFMDAIDDALSVGYSNG